MKRWKDRAGAWGIPFVIGMGLVLIPHGLPSVLANPPSFTHTPDFPKQPSPASPFEEEKPPILYYPDEIDHEVAGAIIDAYLGNEKSVRTHLDALRREDEARRREGRPETGLAAGLRDLYDSTLTSREAFLAAQEAGLDEAEAPEEEALISWRLGQDELTRADELYHKSVVNRVGKVLNRLLRSINLTSFVLDPLMAPAIDSTVDLVFHSGDFNGMTIEERKGLVLYQQFLARYPEDPEAERVEKDVARLLAKKREALLAQEIERGEEALEAGDLWMAERNFELALALDSVSTAADEGMQMVEGLRQEERDRQAQALKSSSESLLLTDASDEALYYTLLMATSRRQPTRMRAAANTLASRHQADPLWDVSVDAISLAYELEGQEEKAHQTLREVSRRGRSSSRQAQASLLLEDPQYNQLLAIRAAERQHFKETLSYILGGRETLEQAIIHSPTSILLYGTPAAIPMGAATAAGVGIRGFRVLTGNPVSRSVIIEAAGQYLREHPRGDPHYREVCLLLAEAHEKEERFDRALYYYREAEADPDEIRQLKGRVADIMLERTARTPPQQRAAQFLAILKNYPETEAAREAGRKLRLLLAPQYQGLRLSKEFLQEHPAVAHEGLRLKRALLDDNPDNSEMAADGVTLLETGRLIITFESPEGTTSQVYNLDRVTAERVLRMLREGVYREASQEPEDAAQLFAGQLDLPAFLFARKPAEDRVDRAPEVHLQPYEFLGGEEQDGQSFLPFPEIQGSASMNGVQLEGLLPYEPFGTRLSIGLDDTSPFIGAEIPVPDPLPLNLRINAAPDTHALPSISPQIRLFKEKIPDAPLYK
ncbi:MAG: tol-pal system YbgF family protein [Candidatus Methylomirabilales bacterium]